MSIHGSFPGRSLQIRKPEKISDWEDNHAYGSHAIAPLHLVCCTPNLPGNTQLSRQSLTVIIPCVATKAT